MLLYKLGSNGILAAGLSHYSFYPRAFAPFCIFNYTMLETIKPPIHKATPEHPLSKVTESKQICNPRKKVSPISHEFWFAYSSAPITIAILALPTAGFTSFSLSGATPRPFRFLKNKTPFPSPVAPSDGSTHWHHRALVHMLFKKPIEPSLTSER